MAEDAAVVADYRNLTDVQWRKVAEPEGGLFLAEGAKVIARAAAAGFEPRSALTSPRWLPGVEEALAPFDVDIYVAPEEVLRGIVGFRLHRGALAAFVRKPMPDLEAVLVGARRVVVLEDLVDHTNVGLIMRTAAAVGFDAALISPRCADPYYRRAVKTSMGAVLSLPWTVLEPWPDGIGALQAAGFEVAALTPADDAESLETWRPASPKVALVLGTEGDGVSVAAERASDVRVRIPMSSRVDSLNVAAAAAIACYEVVKVRAG